MQQGQPKPRTWRELLSNLSAEEKRRIIDELGIQSKTLGRWIRGQTELPRPGRIRQLLNILPPGTRTLFIESIQEDPNFSRYASEISPPSSKVEIPSTFYSRILEANVITPANLRFTTICQLILLQIVRQLDLDHLGLSVIILKCTPPAQATRVRTLYQQASLGTPPWNTVIEQKSFFLGAESLAGQAVMTHRPIFMQDIRGDGDPALLSAHWDEYTVGAGAFPIEKNERVAGCLLIRSTQGDFFTYRRLTLIQQYCHLLVIAIDDGEFYEPQQIELRLVPSIEVQQAYLAQFHKWVSTVIKQAHVSKQPKNWLEAEREVRQHIEAELLEGNA